MPVRMCLVAGCPNTAARNGRCLDHARATERIAARARPEHRKVYNTKRWAMTRRAVLSRAGYFCEDGRTCGREALARDVDHITPLADGGAPYSMSNLQAICQPCHHAKTTAENHSR